MSKKRITNTVVIIVILFIISKVITDFSTAKKMDKLGVFRTAEIVEVVSGVHSTMRVNYKYSNSNNNEVIHTYLYSIVLYDYSFKEGERYLCKVLTDNDYERSYFYPEIKLPEFLTIFHDPVGFFEGDTMIDVLRL